MEVDDALSRQELPFGSRLDMKGGLTILVLAALLLLIPLAALEWVSDDSDESAESAASPPRNELKELYGEVDAVKNGATIQPADALRNVSETTTGGSEIESSTGSQRSAARPGVAAKEPEHRSGGVKFYIPNDSMGPRPSWALTMIDVPYPLNPSSWPKSNATGVIRGGFTRSFQCDKSRRSVFVPYFGFSRIAALIRIQGSPPFLVENVECSSPGSDPAIEVLQIPEDKGGALSGTVTGPSGEPWDEGRVLFQPSQGNVNLALNSLFRSAKSSSEISATGRFHLDSLMPTRTGRLTVLRGIQTLVAVDDIAINDDQTTFVRVDVPKSRPITFSIAYGNLPVAGLQVIGLPTVRGRRLKPSLRWNCIAESDAKGRAELLIPFETARLQYRLRPPPEEKRGGRVIWTPAEIKGGAASTRDSADLLRLLEWKVLKALPNDTGLPTEGVIRVDLRPVAIRVLSEGPDALAIRLRKAAESGDARRSGLPDHVVEAMLEKDFEVVSRWVFSGS